MKRSVKSKKAATPKRRPFLAKTTAASRLAQLQKGYDELRRICNRQKRALGPLIRTARLASEYCIAVDNRENDIGGSRDTLTILRELGPACDASDPYVPSLPASSEVSEPQAAPSLPEETAPPVPAP